MYGLSDQPNGIPCTRFSAERQGSSRYSTRIPVAKSSEHTFAVPVEVEPGILRVTLPLPTGPRHVHCYLLRGDDGWTLVDTGLGLLEPPWEEILAQVDGPVVRIFITHMHPDHVGGAEAAARATGAPVLQGRLDYAQCERVWGVDRLAGADRGLVPPQRRAGRRRRGADRVRATSSPTSSASRGTRRSSTRATRSTAGACSRRPATRTATSASTATASSSPATTLLAPITPAIGLYPESRPDPLGDYLGVAARDVAELAPRVSYGGHGATDRRRRRARAREIVAHHDERLDRPRPRSAREPRTGYDVSHDLFGARAAADPAPLRRRRDALAPRAARRPRARAPRPRTTGPLPILRA